MTRAMAHGVAFRSKAISAKVGERRHHEDGLEFDNEHESCWRKIFNGIFKRIFVLLTKSKTILVNFL